MLQNIKQAEKMSQTYLYESFGHMGKQHTRNWISPF